MNRFIDSTELKVLIFIPLLVYFFYAIAGVFFWIAAYDFMYTNNFTDAEMDEAIISSPLIIGVLLFIHGFFNMLTAYLVAGYLKGNFVKSAVSTIIVVEVIDVLVMYVLPADDIVYPLWQELVFFAVGWGAIVLGAWAACYKRDRQAKLS
ncbi:hypothetical protein [Pseudoalteromonas ardens]|uniref:DUF2569 domain-containing protein n=1 Tax=Pseudoalteromonas rubra TaxID=43658 RepID=A0A0L0ETU4_9GAMM|nr:hypothetical protein [Pseudoalteromonas sp. R96]KNC67800.1 hypothetical protein AC626_08430 [Pseudoalteromonas rubra]MDK1313145.1 hypothetical protein [Pseudoalteromonas sp. R96]